MAPGENKRKRGFKEVGGHLRLPVEEAADGLGPAKSAPGVMRPRLPDGASRTWSHMSLILGGS